MSAPRVVSLLPSATEVAVALGLGDGLVGRSHECDWPPFVRDLPVLTSTRLEKGLGSRAIEDRVRAIVAGGLSVYDVDAERLRALRPDVVLTQSQCAVCAVTPADLETCLAEWTGTAPVLVSLAPDTLGDAWDDVLRVGEATGRAGEAARVAADLRARVEALTARRSGAARRPTVAAIEWLDPLMAAGNWVPELVRAAGGEPLFAEAGQHSPWLDPEALFAADPDVIVALPCGYRIEETLAELPDLLGRPGWAGLSAVRAGRVFAADGHHYFNRPGPRLVESAEILAVCVDACATDAAAGKGWMRVAG